MKVYGLIRNGAKGWMSGAAVYRIQMSEPSGFSFGAKAETTYDNAIRLVIARRAVAASDAQHGSTR
ncbi:hypothetical protein AX279_02665 [Pseudomonas sp. J237]|nr:hypothetical protein AX279_02665 [Pseudomonas sp. J237]HCP56197.1 hypothetical protein [Pseudomonas sp.]